MINQTHTIPSRPIGALDCREEAQRSQQVQVPTIPPQSTLVLNQNSPQDLCHMLAQFAVESDSKQSSDITPADLARTALMIRLQIESGIRYRILFNRKSDQHGIDIGGYVKSKATGALSDDILNDILELSRYVRDKYSNASQIVYQRLIESMFPITSLVKTVNGTSELFRDGRADNRLTYDYYDGGFDRGLGNSAGFLLLVTLRESLQNKGNAQHLVHSELEFHHSEGRRYAFAFGRLAQFAEQHPDLTPQSSARLIHTYLAQKRTKDGLHPDYGVRLHQRAGADIICAIPFCAYDPHSHHHGFLSSYDLKKLCGD